MAEMKKFTKMETEIFLHRLAAPDSIAEVFEDYDQDKVYEIARKLSKGDLVGAEAIDKELTDEILAETVEGSTFFGSSLMGESDQKQNAILRAGNSLARKIGDYIGREIEYPSY